jgi:macrolide transport system ATP-binding/permease protein
MLRRLMNSLRRKRSNDEIQEEIEFHRSQTSGSFGNATVIREQMRDASTMVQLESWLQDLRYGLRILARTPGVSAIAILSLALGIGANTAIFSLVDRVMLSFLPVKQPAQLVLFNQAEPYPRFVEFAKRSQAFSGLAGSASLAGVVFNGSDHSENSLTGRLVSGNYFDVLGVQALIGRALSEADDIGFGAHPEVVISYALWQGRFHGDPEIVGKTIRLGVGRLSSGWGSSGFEEDQPGVPSNRDFTILGVMPASFIGETVGEQPAFWASLTMEEHFLPGRHWLTRRTARWVQGIARLKPSFTIKQAESATNILNRQLLTEEKGSGLTEVLRREIEQDRIKLLDGSKGFSDLRNQFAKPLWILMAMVCVVLLIACANLANLLLARGTARRREIGTRLALGVDRRRLVRQLMTESFLLSLCGAVLSVPIGWLASRALFTMVSAGNPALTINLVPDGRVLLFTGALAVLTTLLFGVAPALRSTRVDLQSVLKENEHATANSRSRMTGEKAVVVIQVALSTTLLFGMALFTRTLYNLRSQDLGYSPQRLITARVDPIRAGYKGDEIGQIAQRVLEKLRTLPGITAVSYSDNGLFADQDSGTRIRVKGFVPASPKDSSAHFDQVGPGYFATVGIPLLLGRDFADTDTAHAPRVTVINESMAKFYFGKRSPLGETIFYDSQLKFTLTVIGVAKDVRDHLVRDQPPRRFYVSYMQPVDGQMGTDFEIRSALAPAVLDRQLAEAVRSVSPRLSIESVRALETSIDNSLLRERLIARLSILFGLLSLLLGCAGLFGIMAYTVGRRTQEIGIRIAIGGQPHNVIWAIVSETLWLVAAGLLVGIPVALALSRYLRSLLFGLASVDGWSICAVVVIIGFMALAASVIPARRAARIDPVTALRCE